MSELEHRHFVDAAARIASWRRPLLVSHEKPDGDALGSLVAMRALLRSQGIEATAMLFEPLPHRYGVFHRYAAMPVSQGSAGAVSLDDHDGVIVLDTCTYNQLQPMAAWLRAAKVPKLAVDHHVTRDELADHYVIDSAAAATCLILYEWSRALDWPLTAEACEAMFIGIAMDTGWFKHSNTDHRTLAAAADLVQRGVLPHELNQELFLRESPGRVRLLGVALGTLELHEADRVAVLTLSKAAMAGVGAAPADTEDIVNEPLRIRSVVVSLLLVEHADGIVRVSFRSKPPIGVGQQAEGPPSADIDVAAVAQALGGGGHRRAAGARIPGTLQEVRARVLDHVKGRLSLR